MKEREEKRESHGGKPQGVVGVGGGVGGTKVHSIPG